ASRPRAVVIDREYGEADDVLRRMREMRETRELRAQPDPEPDRATVFLVIRDAAGPPPSGAHGLVLEPVLGHALVLADRTIAVHDRRALALDRLLTLSLLSGPLDAALEAAASQIAMGFGVDRCVISLRGDHGQYCRVAAEAGATLIAPHPTKATACES